MSDAGETEQLAPIIIVRRGGGHHDEHHGGVWKIAFADFMTAMMAFFLVMWLVNAANEETKAQVASYFNPIKLTDTRAVPKGVRGAEQQIEHDAEEVDAGISDDLKIKARDAQGAVADSESDVEEENAENKQFNEEALFKDPYAVLAEIAGDEGQGEPVRVIVPRGPNDAGLTGGEAFRDPFDPSYWQHGPGVVVRKDDEPVAGTGKFAMSEVRKLLGEADEEDKSGGTGKIITGKIPAEMTPNEQMASPHRDDPGKLMMSQASPRPMKMSAIPPISEMAGPPAKAVMVKEITSQTKARKVEAQLAKMIKDSGFAVGPQISVEGTGEGVLVRLTDGRDFSMFSISSAKPRREMVQMMEQVAMVLQKTGGQIILRGHTDGRPFRSEQYDNWRLSTARAHMAYHMLVRGGIGKERFIRIEGRADRDLKVKDDPEAAQNRRIEILIQDPAS